jgi:hypothetical protein
VLETHAWDATFAQAAQLTHSYRGPKLAVPPNRLRIFSGTSNPVRPRMPMGKSFFCSAVQ